MLSFFCLIHCPREAPPLACGAVCTCGYKQCCSRDPCSRNPLASRCKNTTSTLCAHAAVCGKIYGCKICGMSTLSTDLPLAVRGSADTCGTPRTDYHVFKPRPAVAGLSWRRVDTVSPATAAAAARMRTGMQSVSKLQAVTASSAGMSWLCTFQEHAGVHPATRRRKGVFC